MKRNFNFKKHHIKLLFLIPIILFCVGLIPRLGIGDNNIYINKPYSSSKVILGSGIYTVGDSIEIADIPIENIFSLTKNEANDLVFRKGQEERKVVYNQSRVISAELSPNKGMLGIRVYEDGSIGASVKSYIYNIAEKSTTELVSAHQPTGQLHWLGDKHLFFTSYCGTSCQGLILVNVETIKEYSTTLTLITGSTYTNGDRNGEAYTIFPSWFGGKYKLDGYIKEMRSESNSANSYLVFDMENNKGLYTKTYKYRFGDNLLTLVD